LLVVVVYINGSADAYIKILNMAAGQYASLGNKISEYNLFYD